MAWKFKQGHTGVWRSQTGGTVNRGREILEEVQQGEGWGDSGSSDCDYCYYDYCEHKENDVS